MAESSPFHRWTRASRRWLPARRPGQGPVRGCGPVQAPARVPVALPPHWREPAGVPDLALRAAAPEDAEAARAMHARCSDRTLSRRYHGPVGDADRYLSHLLTPRHGHVLAAEAAGGALVALGHLLWDGEEMEVALLVEDAWQRRGLGTALLRRLLELARRSGCPSVYAVTHASNDGMIAAMRSTGLPLEYQRSEGTLVITARLTPRHVPTDARSALT